MTHCLHWALSNRNHKNCSSFFRIVFEMKPTNGQKVGLTIVVIQQKKKEEKQKNKRRKDAFSPLYLFHQDYDLTQLLIPAKFFVFLIDNFDFPLLNSSSVYVRFLELSCAAIFVYNLSKVTITYCRIDLFQIDKYRTNVSASLHLCVNVCQSIYASHIPLKHIKLVQ